MDNLTKQRYISTSIWSDDWFDSLSEREQLLYLYLLSNEHTNAAGVYPCTLKNIRSERGLEREEIERIMKKFADAGKAFHYKGYVIIPKWLKHQKVGQRSTMFLGAQRVLKNLPAEIQAFISDRSHYDYDISEIIGGENIPDVPEEDTPPIAYPQKEDSLSQKTSSLSIDYQENGIAYPQNGDFSPHDSDSDSKFNSDLNIISSGSGEPPIEEQPKQKPVKPKKLPLRERNPENDMERVEKVYLQNWDALYSRQQVQTPNPVVNWTQTRKLLKDHFEKRKLSPEQIIKAINNGLKDDWIMSKGYSLAMMLSTSTLNKLINAAHPEQAISKEEATGIWNKAREHWDAQGLKPECRNDVMKKEDIPAILVTFQNYTLAEIKNAIENFSWHKTQAGPGYRPPIQYGSLAGFLKNGVEKYFDDNALDEQFKEEKR